MRSKQQKRSRLAWAIAALVGLTSSICNADPCGMVPPITTGPTFPLVRVGDQHTYVFYKDGIETIVIRPGFSGKVDEFGMLIPFPTPPAIRKVPDEIFPHIAAAIDPPEVVINPTIYYRFSALAAAPSSAADGLEFEAVRVIRQEAVGMYEVAVLEAGSARALQRWMDDHNYKYPDGMDEACEDYVNEGWCFVAVKTRVGQKQGVDPRPGQQDVNAQLPDGATFDGHVQAMGFRFRVEKMVVPMRLSTFNEGDLKNTVYILADQPLRVANLPTDLVVRQLSGKKLFDNVTKPLPLRVIGQKLTEQLIKQYAPQRDPKPKNGAAKELFASDLLSVANGELALPYEEREKELLSISESLGLRGEDIDAVHGDTLEKERRETIAAAIEKVKSMTLTVVDGDFPRDVLASENLTFSQFTMNDAKNSPEVYDAKLKGASPPQQGTLHLGSTDTILRQRQRASIGFVFGSTLVSLGLFGLVVSPQRKTVASVLLLGLVLLAPTTADAADSERNDWKLPEMSNEQLVSLFTERYEAEAAATEIINRGLEAFDILNEIAVDREAPLVQRGWAISCLGQIGGPQIEPVLAKIHHDENESKLVRTWAAAARVAMTDTVDLLVERAQLVELFPAVGRPLAKKLIAKLQEGDEVSATQLVALTIKIPALQRALTEPILATGPDALVKVMISADDPEVRRQAAAYVGTAASQSTGVSESVASAYSFDKDAKSVPWENGPLYIPRISWQQDKARNLVDNLIRWHVWCDGRQLHEEQTQIHNNLRSLYLAGAAGYQSPGFQDISTAEWLKIWSAVVGRDKIVEILEEQGISPRKYGVN